jgi:cytidylate kinase
MEFAFNFGCHCDGLIFLWKDIDMKLIIAIDGPAAAGKSTVAKRVAKHLNITYIDTGAMYRAFTLYVIKKGLSPENQADSEACIPEVHIELKPTGEIYLNGNDVSKEIREPHVSSQVSYIASYKAIRLALVELQRKMAEKQSVVMDGRDIGTFVLPQANVKIYQIASVETRAVRRYEENLEKGIQTSLESVEEELRKRDYIDSHRVFAPLKPAPDSVLIDTSFMKVDDVVHRILEIVEKKRIVGV